MKYLDTIATIKDQELKISTLKNYFQALKWYFCNIKKRP